MTPLPNIYADFHNADQQGRLRLNCQGTIEDLSRQDVSLCEGLILRLYMEDVAAVGIVQFSQAENLWVAAIDWKALDYSNNYIHSWERLYDDALSDEALVVRGGKLNEEVVIRCTGAYPMGAQGISVVSAHGKSLAELVATIPHRVIVTTTVGDIRRSGGNVIRAHGKSPYHAILLATDIPARLERNQAPGSFASISAGPHVFGDFNNTTTEGYVRLNTIGANDDLQVQRLQLFEGQQLTLYDLDEFVVTAIVRWHRREGWVAEVDWTKLDSGAMS